MNNEIKNQVYCKKRKTITERCSVLENYNDVEPDGKRYFSYEDIINYISQRYDVLNINRSLR